MTMVQSQKFQNSNRTPTFYLPGYGKGHFKEKMKESLYAHVKKPARVIRITYFESKKSTGYFYIILNS